MTELYDVAIDPARCDRCGDCVPACPRGLIRMAERWQINWLECDACGDCVRACPQDAVRVTPLRPAPAREERIVYVPAGSRGGVLTAVDAVVRRAGLGDLDAVVVASLSGSTAVLVARALEEVPHRLICVADTNEWAAYGHPYPTLEERHRLELDARGARILRDYRSSSAGLPRRDPVTGRMEPLSPAEAGLFWQGVALVGGEGLKTAVKSVALAVDNGLLEAGARVAALGGTGGREAAVVMIAAGQAELFAGASVPFREILCLPA